MNQGVDASILESLQSCPQCGSTSWESLTQPIEDQLLGLYPGVRFASSQCQKCNFVFTNPRVKEDFIPNFYPDNYGPHSSQNLAAILSNPARASRLSEARRHWLSRIVGKNSRATLQDRLLTLCLGRTRSFLANPLWFLGHGARLLDIGCGAGAFLIQQKQLGWDCAGVEISPNLDDHFDKAGIALLGKTVLDVPQGQKFQAVVLNQVLEHIYDYKTHLRKIADILDENGVLYLNIPTTDSILFRVYGRYWYALDLPRHVYFFDEKTLATALKEAGLELKATYRLSSTKNLTRSEEYTTRSGEIGSIWQRLIRSVWRTFPQSTIRLLDIIGWGDNLHALAVKHKA